MQSFTAEQIETGHLHRRKKRELPRRRRKDSRTTAYEQTIRVPDEHRVFKKSKPLIDPLMANDAARFLQEVEKLPFGYLKVTLLLLLNTGMRPEEMLAIRAGNIVFDGNETIISITGALDRDGKTVKDYPKSDAGRRSVPVDDYTADTARAWIKLKSEMAKDQGLKLSMSMLVCGPEMIPRTYQSWYRDWLRFAADAGFEGVRPYALRHTFATLNLANGENIKTVAVLSQGESGGPSQAFSSPRSARSVSRSLCRIESICRFASKRFSSEQLGFTAPPQLSI